MPRLLPSAKLPKTTAASIGDSGRLPPLARPLFQLDPPCGLGEVATNELRHRLDHLSGQIRRVGLRRLLSPRGLKEAATAAWAQDWREERSGDADIARYVPSSSVVTIVAHTDGGGQSWGGRAGISSICPHVAALLTPRLPPLRGLGVAKGRDQKGKRIREREEDVRPAAAPPSAVNARATLLAAAT
uniref:Uncharacterized protein n=1 Tax=Oryza glumipatula TaxID=40148 RepID=A0A0E0A019_9ORYZ